jgi:hypothetical protein
VRSKDVKIGMPVRVTKTLLYPHLLGQIGVVTERYGDRSAAFEVLFEVDGCAELFWHYQFEETLG